MIDSEITDIEATIAKKVLKQLKDTNRTYNQLKRAVRANTDEREKKLKEVLRKLEIVGKICTIENDEYMLFPKTNQLAIGEVKVNSEDKIYVKVGANQIFIDEAQLNGAIIGDIVRIQRCNYKIGGRSRGEIEKVLVRDKGTLIFDYIDGELIPYNWPNVLKIKIHKSQLKKLSNGSRILVKVSLDHDEDGVYDASVASIIGHKDDPYIDVNTIVSKFNVVIDFSTESKIQAAKLPRKVTEQEIQERIAKGGLDLRDKTVFTIDGKGAKDKDDAVSIEKLPNGNYILGVHIADVSHYIPENSPLDLEARQRSTSIYPYVTSIPMLPEIISSDICSLNPNEDKLTFSCIMEITPDGEIFDYQVVDTIIRSRMQMAYSDINDIFERGIMISEYKPYLKDLSLLAELSEVLNLAKIKRKAIDSNDDDEVRFEDDNGIPISVHPRERGMAEKMIENFMLAANESVAAFTYWLEQPAIYRNHPKPNVDSIKEIIKLLGLNIPIPHNLDNSFALRNIMNIIKKHDENGIYSSLILQAQKKAFYSDINEGHFSLALQEYTHFTSPIRRYPDLMLHRLVRTIRDDILSINEQEVHKKLCPICEYVSSQEKLAAKIEKVVNQYKMVEYMEQHIDSSFAANITFIGHNSITIKTEDGISGKIGFDSLRKQGFSYDSRSASFINYEKNITLYIGDSVRILVESANKKTGKMELSFVQKLDKQLRLNAI